MTHYFSPMPFILIDMKHQPLFLLNVWMLSLYDYYPIHINTSEPEKEQRHGWHDRLDQVERDVVKSWINLSLTNGRPLDRWPEAVIEDFKKNKTKHKEASFYRSSLLKLYPFINDLEQHNIGWARLQFEESEVILSTMQKLMKKGIPSYPAHDSIIVREASSEDAMCCLKDCFGDRLGGEVIVRVSDWKWVHSY